MDGTHRRLAIVLLALLTVAAGCTGGANTSQGGDLDLRSGDDGFAGQSGGGGGEAQPTAAPRATSVADVEDGEYDVAQFAQRQLILTGQIQLEVDDFEAARANLTEVAERRGGFVSDTSQHVNRRDNETWTVGRIVLRVPRDNFTSAFEAAKAEGTVLEANQQSEDVTDQLVDLEARLENLRAERDQLRTLYERANDTETVLQVQERLSEVQGEIERLEARQQSLQRRVALSTITVELAEPRPDRPLPDQWYDVRLLSAFLESVDGVVVTLRALTVALAYALPYLVVFGVPLAAVGYVARQRRGPRAGGRLRRRLGRGPDEPTVEPPDRPAEEEPPLDEPDGDSGDGTGETTDPDADGEDRTATDGTDDS